MLREVWPFVDAHRRAGRPVALARLVGRDGPGSRPLGATMAVAGDSTWRGSLSGGCVEGIVLEAARAVLAGAASHVTAVSPGDDLLPWEDAPACSRRTASPHHARAARARALRHHHGPGQGPSAHCAGRAEAAPPLVDGSHPWPTARRGTCVHRGTDGAAAAAAGRRDGSCRSPGHPGRDLAPQGRHPRPAARPRRLRGLHRHRRRRPCLARRVDRPPSARRTRLGRHPEP